MSTPNALNMTSLRGKTDLKKIGTTLTNLTSNPSASGLSYKINSLVASNVGSTEVRVDVRVNTPNGAFYIIKDVNIPSNTTLNIVTRESGFYLQEDETVGLVVTTSNSIEAVCSYEIIDDAEV